MKFLLAFLLLVCCGCASSDMTVTLFRTAPATGITERYAVNADGRGTKTVSVPSDSVGKSSTSPIDRQLAEQIHALVRDSVQSLSAIQLHGSGAMTTGLDIDAHNRHSEISWDNVDPPKLSTTALDSLYHLMLRAESEMR